MRNKICITYGTAGITNFMFMWVPLVLWVLWVWCRGGLRWMLHKLWVCVIAEEPWTYQITIFYMGFVRKLAQPLPRREILPHYSTSICYTNVLKKNKDKSHQYPCWKYVQKCGTLMKDWFPILVSFVSFILKITILCCFLFKIWKQLFHNL